MRTRCVRRSKSARYCKLCLKSQPRNSTVTNERLGVQVTEQMFFLVQLAAPNYIHSFAVVIQDLISNGELCCLDELFVRAREKLPKHVAIALVSKLRTLALRLRYVDVVLHTRKQRDDAL